MKIKELADVFSAISKEIETNKDYLVFLDQQTGDGDLGIYMDAGYKAAAAYLAECGLTDLGMAMNKTANAFNEAAPSSLGTVTAFIFKGMARSLKGNEDASAADFAQAILAGLQNVSDKTGSKPGEKTILDSLHPAAEALLANADSGCVCATAKAAEAAAKGSEEAKERKAVWGRAAYFGEGSIGKLDGGAETGRLVMKAVAAWAAQK